MNHYNVFCKKFNHEAQLLIIKASSDVEAVNIAHSRLGMGWMTEAYRIEGPTPEPKASLQQATELQIAHQVERRKSWKEVYLKTIYSYRPAVQFSNAQVGQAGIQGQWVTTTPFTHVDAVAAANQALQAFDKAFPTIHAQ